MMCDTRTTIEKRFAHVEAEKTEGGMFWCVRVNHGNRIVKGLSRQQADDVCEAIGHAQRCAVENTMRSIRRAIGAE